MAYNKNIDYKTLLDEMMERGASADDVQRELNNRVAKASDTPGLQQFAYDDTYYKTLDYINAEKQRQQQQQLAGYAALAAQGQQAAIKSNDAATESAIKTLDAQIPNINKAYDSLQRENEVNNRIEQENIRRASIYGGYADTGLTDTLKTAQSTAYQSLRNQNEQDREAAIKAIEDEKASVRLTGDINKANMTAQYYSDLAAQAYNRELAELNRQWEREDQATNLILNGIYTPQLAEQSGIGQTTAQNIAAQVQQNAQSTQQNTPTVTFAQAKSLLDGGTYTPELLAVYESSVGTPYFQSNLGNYAIQIMNMLENARTNDGSPQSPAWIRSALDSYLANGQINEKEHGILAYLLID